MTSQAVRDARAAVRRLRRGGRLVPGARVSRAKYESVYEVSEGDLNALESAVRADEAAGLVDILARLLQLVEDGDECCNGKLYAAHRGVLEHTPDCPWVEGMNAVAERRGNA